MTIKDIAKLANVGQSTVRRWITKNGSFPAGSKMVAAEAKMVAAGHGKSAEFDLDENNAVEYWNNLPRTDIY